MEGCQRRLVSIRIDSAMLAIGYILWESTVHLAGHIDYRVTYRIGMQRIQYCDLTAHSQKTTITILYVLFTGTWKPVRFAYAA